MKVAIFGSCVSRDSVEFMPEAEVVAYVARHSVTSLEAPHGTAGVDLSELTSAFQERMVTNDLHGSGSRTDRSHRERPRCRSPRLGRRTTGVLGVS